MVESFLKHLRYEKRASPNTVLAYQNDLQQFLKFLKATFSCEDVAFAEYGMVRSWIVQLVESGMEPGSVNRKIACLRTYYKFLMRQEVIARDPMMKIKILKTKKKLPGFVKEGDMVNLLDNQIFENTFEGCRDRLIIELFYGTGIRLSELISLREDAIDISQRTIKVLGKRNKERVIPFPLSLVKIIKQYKSFRKAEVAVKDHGFLLVTASGEPCYPMMIYRKVKDQLSGYTSLERKSPHVLRHTYATHLLNKGAELNAVKDLLGHSSLAATQVYTHNSMEKLKKVFEQAHPKA